LGRAYSPKTCGRRHEYLEIYRENGKAQSTRTQHGLLAEFTHFFRGNYVGAEKYALDPLMSFYVSNFDLPTGVRYIVACGENLPFKDGCFDIVISTNTLDHTRAPVAVLNEAYRCLRPGGRLILTACCVSLSEKTLWLVAEIAQLDLAHPFSMTAKDLRNLINTVGFNIVTIRKGQIAKQPLSHPPFLPSLLRRAQEIRKEKGLGMLLLRSAIWGLRFIAWKLFFPWRNIPQDVLKTRRAEFHVLARG